MEWSDAAWGVAICRIILSFAWECRIGVWFGFDRSALLLAVGACVVLSFEAMPGLCCFLRFLRNTSCGVVQEGATHVHEFPVNTAWLTKKPPYAWYHGTECVSLMIVPGARIWC